MPGFQWLNTQSAPTTSVQTGNRIAQAFDAASQSTGTSFDYLLKTAQRESSLDPTAKAKTSSASGLFQFIESTWLETVKQSGSEFGLGSYADAIEMGADGRYRVADPALRETILNLRHDPEVASTMAGALTRRNAGYLSARLGRPVTDGELYIAHFLGARGAASLIAVAAQVPQAKAADLFPKQAAANKSIFFAEGRARSVSEVYANLVAKHGGEADAVPATVTAFADPMPESADSAPSGGAFAFAAASDRVDQGWFASRGETAFQALFAGSTPTETASAERPPAFQVYQLAPALFDVAAAEDTSGFVDEERPSVPLPPAMRANPSLAEFVALRQQQRGPLDLSTFLRPQDVDG